MLPGFSTVSCNCARPRCVVMLRQNVVGCCIGNRYGQQEATAGRGNDMEVFGSLECEETRGRSGKPKCAPHHTAVGPTSLRRRCGPIERRVLLASASDEPSHQRCIAIAKESSVVASADRSPFSELATYAPTDVRRYPTDHDGDCAIRDVRSTSTPANCTAPLASARRAAEPDPVPIMRLDDGSWRYIAGDLTPPLAQSISGHSHLFRKPFRHGGGPL